MDFCIDFSYLIPEAIALAVEISRIHAIADGQTPDDDRDLSDGQGEKDD